MQKQNQQTCRRSFDFSSYMAGATPGYEKAIFEQHLCDCNDCFDLFITTLNQHLDQMNHAMPRPQIGSAKMRPRINCYDGAAVSFR